MIRALFVFTMLLGTSIVHAFNWSVNEYIEKCSIVHQKNIQPEQMEVVGYCMGVLKGAMSGIFVTRAIDTGEFISPSCISSAEGKNTFWEMQKNVLAIMQLNDKKLKASSEPDTANAAVVNALFSLYPCLLKRPNQDDQSIYLEKKNELGE
ncbi:MAG: hypothetical protein OEZ10_13530 [Gammaproteobacteria bacterium]|nr:hypothetical protein [Gammaproteobacteria bacterium]